MYDLELAVSQDLGKITANFDEIKTALAGQLEEYKDKEFTEDKKKDAKEDLASLRKLKKSVDDRRKEVKKGQQRNSRGTAEGHRWNSRGTQTRM